MVTGNRDSCLLVLNSKQQMVGGTRIPSITCNEPGERTSVSWGRCLLVQRSLGLDKMTKTKKAWIMVNNVYCSTCELRSLFSLTIYCSSSNLRLRSTGCGYPVVGHRVSLCIRGVGGRGFREIPSLWVLASTTYSTLSMIDLDVSRVPFSSSKK